MNANLSTSRITALFVLIAIGAQLPDTLRPYNPGVDEGFMLQAVLRSVTGHGFNVNLNDALTDLVSPEYYHLYQWPPGYCLVVLFLAKIGLSAASSVKLIDVSAVIIGNTGWLLLARNHLKKIPFFLFGAILVCVYRGSQAGATDLIFWAMMPYWLWAIRMALCKTETRLYSHWLWAAALIASAAVIFRFAAGYLMIAGGLVGLLLTAGPLHHRILRAAILSLPPFATILGIFTWNASYTKSVSYLSTSEMGWTLDRLSLYYPTQAFTGEFWGLKLAVTRAFSIVHAPTLAWITLIIIAIFVCGLVYHYHHHLQDKIQKLHVLTMVLAWASLVFYLGIITARFSDTEFGDWTYIEEPRFYNHQLPAFALMWLILFQHLPLNRLHIFQKKWALPTLTCCLLMAWFYDLQGYFRGSFGEGARTPSIETEVRNFAHKHLQMQNLTKHRIFDIEVNYLIWDNAFNATRFAQKEHLLSSANTDSIYVIVIHREHLYDGLPAYDPKKNKGLPPYLLHRDPALPSFYVDALNLALLKHIPNSRTKIYGKGVGPYSASTIRNQYSARTPR